MDTGTVTRWTAGALLGAVALGGLALGPLRAAAASQQPEQIQQLRNVGAAGYEEGMFNDAIEAFRAVAEHPDATAQDHLNLALALYRNRDDGVAAALDAAAALAPDLPGVPYLRGLLAQRAGDFDAALAALRSARDLDPTDPAIRYNLGAVFAQRDDEAAARAEFDVVVAMGFDIGVQHYVSALYRQFQFLLRAGDREAAAPLIELQRAANQRLSQAQRSASALEQSRNSQIIVPTATLAPPRAATTADVRFPATALGGATSDPAAAVLVADLDGDALPDWLTTGPTGGVWLSSRADEGASPLATPMGPAALGDYDRDGAADLYVAHPDGDRLYRNAAAEGGAEPFTAVDIRLPAGGAPTSVLWVDHDHDGDLDVLITHAAAATGVSAANRLLRNQGGAEFVDVTAPAGLAGGHANGAIWGDFDGDHDVDLYLWGTDGNALFSNQRGGNFVELAAAVGAVGGGGTDDVLAEDFDNDGHLDLILAGANGLEALRNTGAGTFRPAPGVTLPAQAPAAAGRGARNPGLAAADWNNDGYIDIVVLTAAGPRFLINAGDFRFEPWDPANAELAALGEAMGAAPPGTGFGIFAADVDGNGGVDVLIAAAAALRWFAQDAPVGRWLSIDLSGVKNNVRGVGAMVEVKAGGRYTLRPLREVPLHFGLGDATSLDVVRIRWPNGIVQNLLDATVDTRVSTTEVERLEGSCPFLYAWDGHRWRFVNEVLGVAPLGMPLAENVYHPPDADEYVPIDGDLLAPRDGFFEIRLTEELRETGYFDAVRLLAVDHPADVWVVPDERFSAPPHPEFRLFPVDAPRPVVAVDQRGVDWTAQLASIDGDWAVPFELGPYDGLATPHELVLTLEGLAEVAGHADSLVGPDDALAGTEGPVGGTRGGVAPRINLFLTGWVYWATGSINIAADQDPRHGFAPVALDVADGAGGWRPAIEDIGLPNGKNSTLVIDLTDHVVASDPRVRLRTTMRLYWDGALYTYGGAYADGLAPRGDWRGAHGVPHAGALRLGVAGPAGGLAGPTAAPAPAGAAPLRVHVLAPHDADLRKRGFSRLLRTADGFETFDYQTVSTTAPWDQHRGYYTRYGSVDELVVDADNRYVVAATGDELAIRFVDSLPATPPGWRRDYLVYLSGWVKDGDPNTAHGDRVAPLPFHGMSAYPYPVSEAYPADAASLQFLETWLTRPSRLINPPLRPGR